MIRENNGKNEKVCLFFASDYHFEMISLPYINENLKKDKNIVVFTENDLNKTIYKLLSNVNLSKEEKENIERVDWKNDNFNKLEKMKKTDNKKETIVFVKGNKNYIDKVNNNINEIENVNNLKIIDCYDINEVQDNVRNIVDKYGQVLSTYGIEKIK